MKLSNRLSLAVTLVSAAALLGSFVAVYVFVGRAEREELDLALAVQAEALLQQTVGSHPPHLALLDGVASVPENLRPEQRYIAVLLDDGTPISTSQNLAAYQTALARLRLRKPIRAAGQSVVLRVGDVDLRGVAMPIGDGTHTLLYAVSSRSVDQDEQYLARTLFALYLAALAATWLFSRWLGNRLARDVSAIGRVAREVAKGHFDARVGGAARGSIETHALAADLDHMIEQLAALVASQRVFVSHAAHELRSPLTSLRGELQLALRRPRDADAYQHTITRVLSDVEDLIRLAEDLLTLAHAQAGDRARGNAALRNVIDDALRMARGPAEARAVQLRVEPFEAALAEQLVLGQRTDLARALRNLVDNAVAHSPEHGVVTLRAERHDGRTWIAVEDRGPGVPEADASNLFKPFFRGAIEQGSERPGAGLGLPIAQQLARATGGDLWLDPGYAQGARFVLALEHAPPAQE